MVFLAVTITFSDLALQIVVGALAAHFVVGYLGLFAAASFGLLGELIVAIIWAILLVVLVHLVTGRRAVRAEG